MKKVGLITFHRNFNFGAALQCASICELVRKFGGDPIVVDYAPFEKKAGLIKGWGFRRVGFKNALKQRFFNVLHGKKAQKNFRRFREYYWNCSDPCAGSDEISAATRGFSHFITGSDQVWRLDRPNPYFLNWRDMADFVKISYAPCCSSAKQPAGREREIGEWIRDIDFLSVRNDFSKKVIEDISGCVAEVVADPTLLVDFPFTDELPRRSPSHFILVYILGEEINGGMSRLLERAKRSHPGARVVAVCPTFLRPPDFSWADDILHGLGPFQWIELFRSASFIITDSFHGTIFSIKFGKPFVSYYREKIRAPRLLDLSKRYLLERNTVSSVDELKDEVLVEPPSIETFERIKEHRNFSLKFLKRALSDL